MSGVDQRHDAPGKPVARHGKQASHGILPDRKAEFRPPDQWLSEKHRKEQAGGYARQLRLHGVGRGQQEGVRDIFWRIGSVIAPLSRLKLLQEEGACLDVYGLSLFQLTKQGAHLGEDAGRLFAKLIPYFLFQIDHASYARLDERPFGEWDIWMNVINVEADHGTTEAALFETFYGEPEDWHTVGWRDMAAFSSCVFRPLEWAGLLTETRDDGVGKHVCHVFKTPLWRSALKLDTDDMLRPISVQ